MTFKRVLIANRGEIALRILRACRTLNLETVAVHSICDRDSIHVRLADHRICIGGNAPNDSYMNVARIMAAVELSGADAVHPGFGFLAENYRFVSILEQEGIKFIGPSSSLIRMMGDKMNAKNTMRKFNIPCIEGSSRPISDNNEDNIKLAKKIGFPVLIKAIAGGGGRGMYPVDRPEDMRNIVSRLRIDAKNFFGESGLLMEKYIARPKHIEVQILGDGKGNAVHLGERDCSLQRRHQKVLEEAPSNFIDSKARADIFAKCINVTQKLLYEGVGTFEFLYEHGKFYFLEMNTRIQVEHPVTEMVTGIDLVAEQIYVAREGKLRIHQKDIAIQGHAIECRINAENPTTQRPSPGKITFYHPPGGPNVRIDTHIYTGFTIVPYYDSMIAKLIVWGTNRGNAIRCMQQALDEIVIRGIDTNIEMHRYLLKDFSILSGDYDVKYLEKILASLISKVSFISKY